MTVEEVKAHLPSGPIGVKCACGLRTEHYGDVMEIPDCPQCGLRNVFVANAVRIEERMRELKYGPR